MPMLREIALAFALSWTWVLPIESATETVLHNFTVPPYGAHPYGGVVHDSAGNLYGTAHDGGISDSGVVWMLNSSGRYTILHNFTGGKDGGNPYAGVTRDPAGNLYGTTYYGGASGAGVVYRIGAAGAEKVLYSFTGGADGSNPQAGVILNSAGHVYGTTYNGGASGAGVVYEINGVGQESVLYSFTGGADGGHPAAGVILDSAGNLYGTTYYGGALGAGVAYKLDNTGHETVLYSFTGGQDGANPNTSLLRDSTGNLYGTTYSGGTRFGTVYKLTAAGQLIVLHVFAGNAPDGYHPTGLAADSAGNLYGTTMGGGHTIYAGVLFKIDPVSHFTVLHQFHDRYDGCEPAGGVTLDSSGNFYGTTLLCGAAFSNAGVGTIFTIDSTGKETAKYNFPLSTDGSDPTGGVIRDSAGNLYGATLYGGSSGSGAVYKVDTAGEETVLYSFSGGADGSNPTGSLLLDSAGNLFGTTEYGGAWGAGIVYQIDTTGHEMVLYSFTGGADGANPLAGVIRDSAGNLYGTTYGGGSGYGVVFKIDTSGHETVLYSFTGGTDGGNPKAGLIRDSEGNLYGTTYWDGTTDYGVVFKIDVAGHETVLCNFNNGAHPEAGVIRDSAGNLYGTTNSGGCCGYGVVYKVDPNGQETVLYNFTGGADGAGPTAGVVLDSSGNLYGTTYLGGSGYGVVYELNPSGQETVLYTFTGGADGRFPAAGLIRDEAGNLYGTTDAGGKESTGVVYKLKP